MRKIIVLITSVVFIFILTACSCNNESKGSANTKTNSNKGNQVSEEYVPKKAELKKLPVYPGALLVYDNETKWSDENSDYWMWVYVTTGSGSEIIEFFKTELQNLGFEIGDASTMGKIFYLYTKDDEIYLENFSWDKSSYKKLPDEVNPDTPGRQYRIIVNLNKWNNR